MLGRSPYLCEAHIVEVEKSAMRILKKSNPYSALAGTPAANRFLPNVAPLQGERHGFAVPELCMTGAPLYTLLHVYPASRQTPFHRR